MKISHGTRIAKIEDSNGYGYATTNMLDSLSRLGYEVNPNDETADVEIWFDQPQHWKFSKGVYKIGYHPWESTLLHKDWVPIMNECDEIWTPSPIIADWYARYGGIKVPIYVYEHGVDPIWSPKERAVEDKFKFLHVGGEAARKGLKETLRAFRLAFPNNNDVELNLKVISDGWNVPWFKKVNIINKRMGLQDLVGLFHDNHAYVYPSWGEGFGLTPIQAMATGMPTITLPGWAPYAKHLDPALSIESKLVKSPWPAVHPGAMLQPKVDDIVDAMRFAYHNYDAAHKSQLDAVPALMDAYNWDKLTQTAFENLASRLQK